MYFKAFSKLFKRDILLLNRASHCQIGMNHFRSPLLLYFDKYSNQYISFISPKPFLNFDESLKKYIEHFNDDEVAKQFFRILKQPNAHEFIKPVAYYTKKFNPSEINRAIYCKELLSIYYTMKFFSDIIQKDKCILLTDSLPAHQIIRSSKSKDAAVYSIMVKLVGEFPNLSIQYTPGHTNLSDLFSRPGGGEKILEFSENHMPVWNKSDDQYIFFKNLSDWLDYRGQRNKKANCEVNSDGIEENVGPDLESKSTEKATELEKVEGAVNSINHLKMKPNEN